DIGKPQPAFVAVAERVSGSILDVGCGTGENALFFAQRGHQVTGVDYLPGPIELAKKKPPNEALRRRSSCMTLYGSIHCSGSSIVSSTAACSTSFRMMIASVMSPGWRLWFNPAGEFFWNASAMRSRATPGRGASRRRL